MREYFHHACRVEEENGRYRPCRFTEAQLAALGALLPAFEKNGRCAAGISLKFETSAEEIGFSYEYTVFHTEFGGFDVYENGVMQESVTLPETSDTGRFSYQKRTEGMCEIEIFLPANAEMTLWEFVPSDARAVPQQEKKILFYGDSWTHSGFITTPSLSFPTLTADFLEMDYINRGVGSLFYNDSYLLEDGIDADIVLVQFGGNDLLARGENNKVIFVNGEARRRTEAEVPQLAEHARAYLRRILALYPKARVFVTTRAPHYEVLEGEAKRANAAFNRAIRSLAAELGITLVEAADLLPNLAACRVEDMAHLSPLGGAMVALSLAKIFS